MMPKITEKGVVGLTISNIERFLKEDSDKENYILQEKISRYLNLRKIYRKLDDTLKADGMVIVVENGSQKYVKLNPAISEKQKLNIQLLDLEKVIYSAMNTSKKSYPKPSPKGEKGGLI